MTKQVYQSYDFNGNQVIDFRVENLASDPTAGNAGRLILNTTSGLLKLDNGSAFGAIKVGAITWGEITSKPTTISGYGITDAYTKTEVDNLISNAGGGDMLKSVYDTDDDGKVNSAVNADAVPWSGVSSKPTTLSGYGITDAYTETEVDNLLADKLDAAGVSAFAATYLDDSDAATTRATLGLTIGTHVQAYDATLAALAAYNTTGILVQTAADTFAGRTLTGTTNQISVSNGDGAAGNPTISLPADVVIPTVLTVPNTGLHILDTNASHDLIIAAGSNLTADRTLTVTTGDAARTIDISAASLTLSAYGATLIDDADAAAARTTLGLGSLATASSITSSSVSDFNTAVDTRVVAYWDSIAGTDANVDTIRETLDLILANAASIQDQIARYNADIGDGSTTSIAVTHSLNSLDVSVEVYEKATGATVGVDVVRTSANVVTITASPALSSASHRVVIKK